MNVCLCINHILCQLDKTNNADRERGERETEKVERIQQSTENIDKLFSLKMTNIRLIITHNDNDSNDDHTTELQK